LHQFVAIWQREQYWVQNVSGNGITHLRTVCGDTGSSPMVVGSGIGGATYFALQLIYDGLVFFRSNAATYKRYCTGKQLGVKYFMAENTGL
jgi:hypothetical protein